MATQPVGTFRQRLGRCYMLAGRFVSYDAPAGTRLVHGTIQGRGHPRTGHAWAILPDGRVWEPITMQVYRPGAFKAIYSAQPVGTYDQQTVLQESLRTGHWGPWS